MPNDWDADIELTQKSAERLIGSQFPELAPVRLERLGAGWDNTAYRVNGSFVFRFPRRRKAVRCLEAELRILPRLARRLTLPIPRLVFTGVPSEEFAFPFAGYEFLSGTPAGEAHWTMESRAQLAEPLGRFLAALHCLPIDDELQTLAPDDFIDRADMPGRAPGMIQRLHAAASRFPELDIRAICERISELATTPKAADVRLVHGDLHPDHLLVCDANGPPGLEPCRALAGIIDWGDCHIGDTALDISIAFSFLPRSARSVFASSYGLIDADTWRRAEFRAYSLAGHFLAEGCETGNTARLEAAKYALRNAVNFGDPFLSRGPGDEP